MKKFYYYQFGLTLLFTTLISLTSAQTLHEGFVERLVSDQLDEPTSMAIAPDGRIFVTEKAGDLRIIENDILLEEPFLHVDVETGGERGLGHMALDPDFEVNGYVYVYYTVIHTKFNRLSRFTANGNAAIPLSEEILYEFNELEGTIHQGGGIRFGTDEKIYVSTGDGSKRPNAQDFENVLGGMIRINKDGTIPEDNPFYEELEGDTRALYAKGLRNPFTFDILSTNNQILVCDVGEGTWEEINEILPGKNYGWDLIEGPLVDQTPPENYMDPVYYYEHANGKCAVVGGVFYDPPVENFPPSFSNKFLFSDYCSGVVQALDPETYEVTDTVLTGGIKITDLYVNDEGILYYLSFSRGELWEVEYTGSGSPFISKQPSTEIRSEGEDLSIDIKVVGDDTLRYVWYKNHEIVSGQDSELFFMQNVMVADSGAPVYCAIYNALDTVWTDTVYLQITSNSRPAITIETDPPNTFNYSAGQTIVLNGTIQDAEDGLIDPQNYQWKMDFHHDEHTHPGIAYTNAGETFSFETARIGEVDTNVWYRVYLKASDSQGLENESYVDFFPNKTTVDLNTYPGAFQMVIDGSWKTAPVTMRSVTGLTRIVYVPEIQVRNDSLFAFVGWEHNSMANPLYFNAGDNPSYTAVFEFRRIFVQGEGTGLLGAYYANAFLEGSPEFTRVDPQIDFHWDWASPLDKFSNYDSVSIKWKGSLLAPITGDYTIKMLYDDGVRLTLGDQLLIDDVRYSNGLNIADPVNFYMESGTKYNLEIEYYEFRFVSECKLLWEFVDQPQQFIPQQFLYTDTILTDFDNGYSNTVKFYPNPVQDELKVRLEAPGVDIDVNVYNEIGDISSINFNVRNAILVVNVKNLETGLYHIVVSVDDKVYTNTFFKE